MTFLYERLSEVGTIEDELEVRLSSDLVGLLSQQLYKSPEKAIEELVVNSYDADAKICKVWIPQGSSQPQSVVVFDDGIGMDEQGLKDLWHIGRSNKRSKEIAKRFKRKQIGKFGIGKLATYAIANRLTYISRTSDKILSVSIDFNQFDPKKAGDHDRAIHLPIINFSDNNALAQEDLYRRSCRLAGMNPDIILQRTRKRPWTLAVLENLRPKSRRLSLGRLRMILSTAMPLVSDFRLFLNKSVVHSAKLKYEKLVEFDICDLPLWRLNDLEKQTGEQWHPKEGALVSSENFPDGIRGSACVAERSLGGKSADIGRSNGFFVYIRNRLTLLCHFGLRAMRRLSTPSVGRIDGGLALAMSGLHLAEDFLGIDVASG